MTRDITFGQYYNVNSFIHDRDPRAKLFITFAYLIGLFLSRSYYYIGGMAIFLILYSLMARLELPLVLRTLKPVRLLILVSVLLNLFYGAGDVVLSVGPIAIKETGVKSAILIGSRMVLMIMFSSTLTFTTMPNALMDGMEKGFSWLKLFKVPVSELALTMSIALRFIPILKLEMDRIMDAQKARGMDFENGGYIKRVKAFTPVIIPMFVSAVKRSEALAMAMDARCYTGGEGRTKLHPLRYKKEDIILYMLGIGIIAAGIVL